MNMAFWSWHQLKLVLLEISDSTEIDEQKYKAFHYAWSIVDNLDRVKSFLEHLKIPLHTDIIRQLGELRSMRNTLHHGYDRIDSSIQLSYPLMGSISWARYINEDTAKLRIFVLPSGNQDSERTYFIPNPGGVAVEIPIGLVHLSAIVVEPEKFPEEKSGTVNHNLSTIMQSVEQNLRFIEGLLSEKFSEPSFQKETTTLEYLISVDYSPKDGVSHYSV